MPLRDLAGEREVVGGQRREVGGQYPVRALEVLADHETAAIGLAQWTQIEMLRNNFV